VWVFRCVGELVLKRAGASGLGGASLAMNDRCTPVSYVSGGDTTGTAPQVTQHCPVVLAESIPEQESDGGF
jgi:hypothetical protein